MTPGRAKNTRDVEPLKHAGINPLERAAYHEAGHAVVWRHFDRRISFIVITEAGNGLTSITRSVQYVGPPRPPEPVPADHPQCVVALAGRAAETIRYPGLQRAELVELSESDQAQAAVLIRELRGSISDNEISAEIAALESLRRLPQVKVCDTEPLLWLRASSMNR